MFNNPNLHHELNYVCPHCNSMLWKEERKHRLNCCKNGKYTIPALKPVPPELMNNFTSKEFQRAQRGYTNVCRLLRMAHFNRDLQLIVLFVIPQTNGENPGKILPASHPGSPAKRKSDTEDALAILNRKGRPHLFSTVTMNANWPEITRNLLPGQTAYDRPGLCCRVQNET